MRPSGIAARRLREGRPSQLPSENLRGAPSPNHADEAAYLPHVVITGRSRHDHKITVYLSASELARLDQAVGYIRYRLGVKTDRGHVVRAAISVMLQDLSNAGSRSWLIDRLREIR